MVKEMKFVPDISIIIPVYNVGQYLDKCIKSVINQTHKDIEIICVDDGSTDASSEICDKYRKIDSRIKVIHKTNGGLALARQAGLRVSRGKYVGFVDGDDWIDKEMYECMFQIIEKYKVDMVETGVIDSYGESLEKERKYKLDGGIYEGEKFKNSILNNLLYDGKFYNYGVNTIYLWNKLFKKDFIYECYMKLDPKQSMFEDYVSVYPYLIKHQSVAVVNKAFYHYRVVNNSLKRSKVNDAMEMLNLHTKLMEEVINKSTCKTNFLHQFNYFKLYFLIMYNIQMFDLGQKKLLIPYGGVDYDEHLILYGAGVNGINIYRYLIENSKCKIIDWVDKMSDKINLSDIGIDYKVNSPDTIDIKGTEKIIITAIKWDMAQSIKNYLINRGVSTDRILWIKNEYVEQPEILLNSIQKHM